ncbi:MAG: amidohydrolase [Planctomycetota bacterium]
MADVILINGNVWTGVRGVARAQALAITGERISAIGTNDAIRSFAGPQTNFIDAHGRLVIPGITDAHVHLIGGGLQLSRIDLRNAKDRADFVRRIAERAKTMRPDEWMLGGRWTVESWTDPASPTKAWVDPVTAEVLLFLTRMDGHQALANSAALKLAGIDAKGPPDPQGGIIERNPQTGEPTGILKDDAMNLVSARIPQPSADERTAALRAAMDHLHRLGVTGVHDMSELDDLPVYARGRADGTLRLRIHSFLQVPDWSKHDDTSAKYPRDDPWWRVAGFKGYMDGSLGSRTAFMREPYTDAMPGTKYPRGLLVDQADPFEDFQQQIIRADAAGWQLAVHAIGDEANHLLLNAYAAAARANGPRHRRPRVEHAQHLLPEDLGRFGRLGVIASMQPLHKADDGRYAEKALGPQRCRTSYAFRALLDAGATLAFGSDWPVVSANPFEGIEAAVTGRTLDGRDFVPAQNITVEEALAAYTIGAAYASARDRECGTLEAGKLADVVILSQDVFAVPPESISETRADVTIVGGRLVWSGSE